MPVQPALKEYRKKRDLKASGEPSGSEDAKPSDSTGHIFVVHKHAATRLHYDLRLEWHGTLMSWAVPKGPSLNPNEKRLAVRVEDHPIEYASFEGVIPEGNYGAGAVMIWDCGTWEPIGDPDDDLANGKLHFVLHGERLQGAFYLVQLKGDRSGNGKNWLLAKAKDEYATSSKEITTLEPFSVKSGLRIEEISERSADPQHSNGCSVLRGARASPMPASFSPQLATATIQPPEGNSWAHEIKFDGYRVLAWKMDGQVRLMSRNGIDLKDRFPAVVHALKSLKADAAILDGEIVMLDENGVSDFQILQNALETSKHIEPVVYFFDLPYCDGFDLTGVRLLERKAILKGLLDPLAPQGVLRYSDHLSGDGSAVFENAKRLGLEGIISKRIDSHYVQRRSSSWLKVKNLQREEFVIVGYTDPSGNRNHFGALLLGYYDDHKLTYAGKVGTGLSEATLERLMSKMRPLETNRNPLQSGAKPPTKGTHFIKPELVAEVEFTEWTKEGLLRHPSFLGQRLDRGPQDVNRMGERVVPKTDYRLTNPSKVLYPSSGTTKQHLADYYLSISEWILPHIVDRPLAIVRCPDGVSGECFFQKHTKKSLPHSIKGVTIQEKGGLKEYMMIEDLEGLMALVQLGTVEYHPWGARSESFDRPDRLIFDLDPAPDVSWSTVIDGALILREELEHLGLACYAKVTGGKGLHLVLPIRAELSWDEAYAIADAFTKEMTRIYADRFVSNIRKIKRKGKILIDFFRNTRGATAIAPYSTRKNVRPTVAMPISWDGLSRVKSADHFTIENAVNHIKHRRVDPWEGFFEQVQSIKSALRRGA